MELLFQQIRMKMHPTKQVLVYSVLPLLKLICLTLIGLILAHPKTQLVPKATFNLLSKLVFALFLPCLIFVDLGQTITFENLIQWWFVPVNVILSTAIGIMLGFSVCKICKPPPEFTRFTVIMTAFGNTGNLDLAIVGSVCRSKDNPFGPECQKNGTAYVSFAQWVAVFLIYSLVYHMMEPPSEYYEVVELQETIVTSDLSGPLVDAEWPGIEDRETEHCKTPLIARVFAESEEGGSCSGGVGSGSSESLRCLAEPGVVRKIRIVAEKTPLSNTLRPPTIAILAAFVVGVIPSIKAVVYGEDAPLLFFTDSLEILANAMVPSVMLILGGMLAEGSNESRLGVRTTIGIIVVRLLVLPLVGIGVVFWLGERVNFLSHGDKMLRFVVLLQYTSPSAILLGAVARLRGYAVKEASAVLFWQHVFAIFSLGLYVVVYFNMLFSNDL